ncbi:MAG: hypothetical protein RR831_01110 [Stenotrophomonas sp.]
MVTKHGWVRNPLSVIAIFAGVAEVCSAAVLPQLEGDAQITFMLFVMFFPCALVGLFFYILWFKAKVLYAPADYKDDATYMAANGLNKYSVYGEVAGDLGTVELSSAESTDWPNEPRASEDASDQDRSNNSDTETKEDQAPESAAASEHQTRQRATQTNEVRSIESDDSISLGLGIAVSPADAESFDEYVAEKKGLSWLHKKFGGTITAPVIMSADGGAPYLIDGFIENEKNQYFVEVIYATKSLNGSRVLSAAKRLANAWNAAPVNEQRLMTCVICIVGTSKDDLRYHQAYARSLLVSSHPAVRFQIETLAISELY